MTAEVVIDLGLDRAPSEDEGPRWSLRRQWARWRRWGRTVSCGLCVVAVAASAASAPPPSPGLTLVATVGEVGDYFQISGDVLILYKQDGTASVHRLATGDQLWTDSSRLPQPSDTPGVLYGSACASGGAGCPAVDTIALDAATGAELWSVPGNPVPGTDGRLHVVTGHEMVTVTDGPSTYRLPLSLEVRDETGATRWSVERPTGLSYFLAPEDGGAPQIYLYERFSLEVRDAFTGAVRGRYQAPAQEPILWVLLVDSPQALVVVESVGVDEEATYTLVRALEPGTLTPRWELRMPSEGVYIRACGALLCAQPPRHAQVTHVVLDPRTGAELWTAEGLVDAVGDHFLVWSDPMVPERPAGTPRVVAARAGETLVDLTGWRAVGRGDAGGVVLTAPTSDGTAVAVLDPGATTPRYLGSVATKLEYCVPFEVGGAGMVCDGDTGITLWSVAGPPPAGES